MSSFVSGGSFILSGSFVSGSLNADLQGPDLGSAILAPGLSGPDLIGVSLAPGGSGLQLGDGGLALADLFHSLSGSDWLFELTICFFLLAGGVFCLGGSIGLLRFPDIYCKMQALSKPVTLGIFNLIIAYILFLLYAGQGLSMKGILAVVFLLLTIPIGSHMIIKASYRSGVPIWTESLMDQLADTLPDGEDNLAAQIRAEVQDEALYKDTMDAYDAYCSYGGSGGYGISETFSGSGAINDSADNPGMGAVGSAGGLERQGVNADGSIGESDRQDVGAGEPNADKPGTPAVSKRLQAMRTPKHTPDPKKSKSRKKNLPKQ